MTGFLAKFGAAILKGLQIVSGLAPIVEQVIPGSSGVMQVVSQDLTQIGTVITNVEAMGQALALNGTQKLTAAAPLVAQIVMASSLMVGKKVANPTLFNSAVSGIASNMADLLNSLQESAVQTTSIT